MIRLVPLVALVAACTAASPRLVEDMPSDLAEVVNATLVRIEEAIPAHTACLEGLVVGYAWELDNRAEYHTDTATVVLRVPATAPHLEFSLAHEVAHHLEATCPAQHDLRRSFLAAQGHRPDADWFDGSTWEETPSEQFATAFAALVTGRSDPQRRVPLTPAALEVVAAWAVGELSHGPSAP